MCVRRRSRLRQVIAALSCLFVLVASLLLAACATPTPTLVIPQESIKVSAASAMVPLLTKLARAFEARNPWAAIVIERVNSYQSLRQALEGTADLGACTVDVADEVWAAPIALDAVTVVVHPDNPLRNLTLAQVRDIFGGRVWRWQDLGIDWGEDEIVVVSREEGSGTRMAFEATAMVVPGSDTCQPRLAVDPEELAEDAVGVEACQGDQVTPTAVIMVGSEAVVAYVQAHRGAIGYVSQAYASMPVKAVSIEGLDPSPAEIQAGSYLLAEPFFLVAPREPEGLARAFVDFCLSAEGQAIVAKEYVPVRK
jgi:phosphate transport system substrate-binding protein